MEETGLSYEQIYYGIWELSSRYGRIAQLRVIGVSRGGRMIPMLELGAGKETVFCLAGTSGGDRQTPALLLKMAGDYCRAWENHWNIEQIYDLRELLDNWKLCFIPVLNPDGYGKGRTEQTCGKNEIRSLIHIFREYKSRGLLSFGEFPDQAASFWKTGINRRFRAAVRTIRPGHFGSAGQGAGYPEKYYVQVCRRPAFCINVSAPRKNFGPGLCILPLEFLYSQR